MGAVIATAFFQCVQALGVNGEGGGGIASSTGVNKDIYERYGVEYDKKPEDECGSGVNSGGCGCVGEVLKVNEGKDFQVVLPLSRLSKLIMPIYFIPNAVLTGSDIKTIGKIWKLIVIGGSESGGSGGGGGEEGEGYTPSARHLQRFVTVFYDRLFDVHPSAKPLFVNGTVSQGRVLIKMISMSISHLHHPDKFQKLISSMAKHHCEYGVKCYEYGIMGEVLFYSLRFTLGNELYDTNADMAWKRLYSAMLSIIIPCCIQYENELRASSTGSLSVDGESKRRSGLGQCRYSGEESSDACKRIGGGGGESGVGFDAGIQQSGIAGGNVTINCGNGGVGMCKEEEYSHNSMFHYNYHTMATMDQKFGGRMDPIRNNSSTFQLQDY